MKWATGEDRFGSFADMQQSPRERPLPGAKQTYLGQPRVGRRVYGKELISVQANTALVNRSASKARLAGFRGVFRTGAFGRPKPHRAKLDITAWLR